MGTFVILKACLSQQSSIIGPKQAIQQTPQVQAKQNVDIAIQQLQHLTHGLHILQPLLFEI